MPVCCDGIEKYWYISILQYGHKTVVTSVTTRYGRYFDDFDWPPAQYGWGNFQNEFIAIRLKRSLRRMG